MPKAGYRQSEAHRNAIQKSLKARHQALSRGKTLWQPPEALAPLFQDLCKKYGRSRAMKLVIEHARVKHIPL